MEKWKLKRREFLKFVSSFAFFGIFSKIERSYSLEKSLLPLRNLGKTGFKVSILGFGAAQIGLGTRTNAFQTLETAIEEGINYFDTASTYNQSETRIGEFLRGNNLKDVIITTKVLSRTKKEATEEIFNSLKRLKLETIDIVHLHSVNDLITLQKIASKDGALEACIDLKKKGYLKFIGITNHNNPLVLKEAMKVYPFANVLIPTGIGDKIFGSYEDLIDYLRENNTGVVGMKVFGAGRYRGKLDFEKCLRYSLGLNVDSTIVGLSNPEEVKIACKIVKTFKEMSPQEIEKFIEEAKPYANEKIMWWR